MLEIFIKMNPIDTFNNSWFITPCLSLLPFQTLPVHSDSWFILGFTEVNMWLKYCLLIGHHSYDKSMNFTIFLGFLINTFNWEILLFVIIKWHNSWFFFKYIIVHKFSRADFSCLIPTLYSFIALSRAF